MKAIVRMGYFQPLVLEPYQAASLVELVGSGKFVKQEGYGMYRKFVDAGSDQPELSVELVPDEQVLDKSQSEIQKLQATVSSLKKDKEELVRKLLETQPSKEKPSNAQ